MTEQHVHDCTGPDMRCQCGFVFQVERYMVSIEVYDNETKWTLVNEAFGTDDLDMVAAELKKAAETCRKRLR